MALRFPSITFSNRWSMVIENPMLKIKRKTKLPSAVAARASRKKGFRQFVFAAVTVAISLCLVEVGGALIEKLSPGVAPPAGILVSDPVFHHRWQPNMQYQDGFRSVPYLLRTNGQRWVEDHDVPQQKPPGVYRIFFLGDSNTQGVVAPEHKMVKLVEKKLNEALGGRRLRVETINTGTSSFSIFQYYLLVRYVLPDFSPDLVVIDVDMTDVPNDFFYRRFAKYDERGDPIAVDSGNSPNRSKKGYRLTPFGTVELSPMENLRLRLHEWSAAFRILERALAVLRPPAPATAVRTHDNSGEETHADWLATSWTPEIRANVEFSMNLLGKAIDLLRARRVRVIVTGVPHYPQFTGSWSVEPHTALRQATLAHGGIFFDTYEALRPIMANSLLTDYYWSNDDTHFNIAGNAAWADALAQFILSQRENLFRDLRN